MDKYSPIELSQLTNGLNAFQQLHSHFNNYSVESRLKLANVKDGGGSCEVDTIDRMSAVVKNSVGKRLKYRDLTKIKQNIVQCIPIKY